MEKLVRARWGPNGGNTIIINNSNNNGDDDGPVPAAPCDVSKVSSRGQPDTAAGNREKRRSLPHIMCYHFFLFFLSFFFFPLLFSFFSFFVFRVFFFLFQCIWVAGVRMVCLSYPARWNGCDLHCYMTAIGSLTLTPYLALTQWLVACLPWLTNT